jgi:hypothetical protein
MNSSSAWAPILSLFALCGGAVFFVIRDRRFGNDLNELLSRGECHGDSLRAVIMGVGAASARCAEWMFDVERAAKVPFRGQVVCFVVGGVGSIVPNKYGSFWRSRWRSLYALAESEKQIAWMAENSGVFSRASTDPTIPLFWVKLSALKADEAMQATAATPHS